ncbi:hypothetical protein BLOT_012163 [Blomia tropicalis]|nr:hypothetical protein BLOT_012163 [Blomia tropicalis]
MIFLLFTFYLIIQSVNMAGVRKVSSSISCFICDSRNWTDSNCHDPFHPAMSKYAENCKVPKQNHIGVFPARFCVKVIGRKISTGEDLVIRACSLESMDNQCGNFKFEGEIYKGCILTCDYDGCNQSSRPLSSNILIGSMVLWFLFGWQHWFTFEC